MPYSLPDLKSILSKPVQAYETDFADLEKVFEEFFNLRYKCPSCHVATMYHRLQAHYYRLTSPILIITMAGKKYEVKPEYRNQTLHHKGGSYDLSKLTDQQAQRLASVGLAQFYLQEIPEETPVKSPSSKKE